MAIDDIVFRTCGDRITLTDAANNTNIVGVCQENAPTTVELTANPDFSVYSTHAYQWQESTDGVNWADIAGETNSTYTSPLIFGTTSYRVKVAEDAVNLTNSKCNAVSDIFEVVIEGKPVAPTSLGDVSVCPLRRLAVSTMGLLPTGTMPLQGEIYYNRAAYFM